MTNSLVTRSTLLLIGCILASSFRPAPMRSGLRQSSRWQLDMAKLVLVRHGESVWNKEGRFTGWHDAPLSTTGDAEAANAGELLKEEGFKFDIAYTSMLQRAIRTLWHSLEKTECMYIPIVNAWELNERYCGALQGLDKKEAAEKYGQNQVNIWRRSYDVPPPDCDEDSSHHPSNDKKYWNMPDARKIKAESLATTSDRVIPFWHRQIAESLRDGKTVIVAAHGNSLRALIKYLDDISEVDIVGINVPTGVPLLYELDDVTLKPIAHPDALAPLKGRYLGDAEEVKARIEGVRNQTTKTIDSTVGAANYCPQNPA